MKNLQITAYTQHFIRQQVMPGDICIDATMGNGNDTVLLSRLAGENGRVLAFDIQKQALEHTEERLKKDDCPENYQLFLDSHENMATYAEAETVSCITFNLGYLPGGRPFCGNQSGQQQKSSGKRPYASEKRRPYDDLYLQRWGYRISGTGCDAFIYPSAGSS